MTNDITTTDLAKFGWREKKLAAELLLKACEYLPEDFYDEEVTIMMNTSSGKVFLTNSDYQVAMINHKSGKLESWYYTPYSGLEGFLNELLPYLKDKTIHKEDRDYIREIKKQREAA